MVDPIGSSSIVLDGGDLDLARIEGPHDLFTERCDVAQVVEVGIETFTRVGCAVLFFIMPPIIPLLLSRTVPSPSRVGDSLSFLP